ncbi:MAG: caspase family protein [Rhodobacteraceae bacterium]|nr:caspase family protein [Paracoccaceae bacterium]
MLRRFLALVLLLLVAPSAALAQAEVTYDQMRALAEGPFASLTQFLPLTEPALAAPCDLTRPGQSHAILFGADSFGPGSGAVLAGAANSIALMAEALTRRGLPADNILRLDGANATRAALAQGAEGLLWRLGCTDHVVLYITGVSASTKSIAEWMTGGWSKDDWISASAETDPLMRGIVASAPFLLGNPSTAAEQEILSAAALSELVTRLRNRAAHVTVILDTTYAAGFDLAARQMRVDPRLLWRESRSSETAGGEAPLPTAPLPTALSARAGALSLLYSADRTSMSAEMRLPDDSPQSPVYNLFGFKLAAAIQADAALTVPSLGRAIAAISLAPQYQHYQNHVIETTDASLPILAELAAAAPVPPALPADGPDVIRITAPEPSRTAAALDDPVLTLKGAVHWPEDTLIVLVGKEQALSRADGSFQHEVALQPGLNRIEIMAMTRDNRQHSKVIEVTYSGGEVARAGTGKRYALLIANQTYGGTTGMPALATPFADADALAAVLTRRYGFVTEATLPDGSPLLLLLKDASRATIEATLFHLSQIAGAEDQVLIYYGGHGVFEEVTGTAFWLPADAVAGVPPSYLSASGISEALLRLQAGSVVVISDSCYSGALMRGAPPQDFAALDAADRARVLDRLSDKRARVLITSGANEPVADGGGDGHSIFARALLTGLTEATGPIAAQELFDDFVFPIVIGRAEQEPQYRPIAKSGHEGGDFVFTPLAP